MMICFNFGPRGHEGTDSEDLDRTFTNFKRILRPCSCSAGCAASVISLLCHRRCSSMNHEGAKIYFQKLGSWQRGADHFTTAFESHRVCSSSFFRSL